MDTPETKDQNRLKLAETWKRRRVALKITQEALATLMGVSQQAISHWERGIAPIPDMAWRLLNYIEQDQAVQGSRSNLHKVQLLNVIVPLLKELFQEYD